MLVVALLLFLLRRQRFSPCLFPGLLGFCWGWIHMGERHLRVGNRGRYQKQLPWNRKWHRLFYHCIFSRYTTIRCLKEIILLLSLPYRCIGYIRILWKTPWDGSGSREFATSSLNGEWATLWNGIKKVALSLWILLLLGNNWISSLRLRRFLHHSNI